MSSKASVDAPRQLMRTAASFATHGHAVVRSVVPEETCRVLRAQALSLLDASANGFAYNWSRFSLPGSALLGGQLEPVRAPWRRHCVTLPPSPALAAATQQLARAALAVGLPSSARLLEQDTTIVLPGAFAQLTHTDISPSVADRGGGAPLVTVWLALQAVTSGMGPTTVYPGSHRRYAARAALQEERAQQVDVELYRRASYCSDGSGGPASTLVSLDEDGNGAARYAMDAELDAAEALDLDREAAQFGAAIPGPVDLLLEVGDCGIMDCRIRHFGSAYAYSWDGPPRVLLNATFGAGDDIAGFTYHRHAGSAMPTLLELTQGM